MIKIKYLEKCNFFRNKTQSEPKFAVIHLVLTLLLLSGCASYVQTDIQSFKTEDFNTNASVSVVPSDAEFSNSLEFKHYQSMLENKLQEQGFRLAENQAAQYLVKLGYHIDDGETDRETTPITGQTGYEGYAYHQRVNHSDGSHSYVRRTHWVPTFGIVGSSTRTYTHFTTLVTIDIVDQQQKEADVSPKVYEVKARSEGRCGVMSRIFDEMLTAIFEDFPGENNRVERVRVVADMPCYPSDTP